MNQLSERPDARRRRVEGPSRDPRDHAGLERPAAHPKGNERSQARTNRTRVISDGAPSRFGGPQ
jgi:hypothetical protein